MSASPAPDAQPIPTGVPGLDVILAGGYAAQRAHLIEGRPGGGKTTLGLQFLLDGAARGETCLYITLSESRRELMSVSERHGWSLEGIEIYELVPPELSLDSKLQQSLVHSSDLELGETVRMALSEMERVKPSRVVFDSLSEIRLLSQGSLRYRRQVLALKSYFLLNDITALMLDDLSAEHDDLNLHSISHAVIRLEQLTPAYGAPRRRVHVIKMRGTEYQGGYHDFAIRKGGILVHPRLIASDHPSSFEAGSVESGVAELDRVLGGGLDRGTTSLIVGPSGAGKSTLAMSYLVAALRRGERGLIISFDETRGILLRRARSVGMPLADFIEAGSLQIEQIDPADVSPGDFAGRIRDAVEHDAARIVIIDSLTGYMTAMAGQPFLVMQMHELVTYLNQQGVVTILILAQHGMVGKMESPVDLTYVSDTVVMLRFFEAAGRVRRALSVLKKRTGPHEDTIREFKIDANGLRVGEPLRKFRGVLTGVPTYDGNGDNLLVERVGADGESLDEPGRDAAS
ncbi:MULTISPECIES: ATPase domain-containing protein [Methylobacterium]|uniref:non-specific serine/threonine protein kinase n=1 Tax=Methylobacterium bullatum TaxID=570505 RepID=A0A679K790_9HYPH|nr:MULTISPECIES: ATPase domain-containing protein [Methylobacterium]MBD8902238.1 circadian clock protein KaiC [Methylobacterium bullatum]TXN28861.1 AAA family ATPase [Methylobacterium sp. WL19]GJD38957.1 Circadian clock protein kinase KaiC [Methylobacterium bullatum]CAA2140578.1 Circadian clock protein kinase KaiC [Methylobacterium bullatum]